MTGDPVPVSGVSPVIGGWTQTRPGYRILVTGGIRSGKSAQAEALLAQEPAVLYLASGPVPGPDDVDWNARVEAHRRRRPSSWVTEETTQVARALREATRPVLWDCVGTWLTAVLDETGAWDDRPGWRAGTAARVDELVEAWAGADAPVVAVTNEVGLSVIPATRAGRVFADQLGTVNVRLGQAADEVHLVVAGRVLRL